MAVDREQTRCRPATSPQTETGWTRRAAPRTNLVEPFVGECDPTPDVIADYLLVQLHGLSSRAADSASRAALERTAKRAARAFAH